MPTRHILGQANLTATTPTAASGTEILYEVPVASESTVGSVVVSPKAASQLVECVVSKIFLCNRTSDQVWVNAYLTSGEDGASTFYLCRVLNIKGAATSVISLNLALSSGDKVEVQATSIFGGWNVSVDATAVGMEMVSGVGASG